MTVFGYTAAPEQRENEANASTEGLAVTPGQSQPPLPQKQSRLLQPQSKRITSGGGDEGADCIPNELTSFRYLLLLTKASIKKLTGSAHVQHFMRNSKPNDFGNVSAQSTGNFSADFEDEGALVCLIRGPPGRNRRWQLHHAPAAKLAFQDEMVSMAALCREEADAGGSGSVWFGGIICLRRGREVRSARTRR